MGIHSRFETALRKAEADNDPWTGVGLIALMITTSVGGTLAFIFAMCTYPITLAIAGGIGLAALCVRGAIAMYRAGADQ